MSITDFLLARIAEDEEVARAAIDDLDFWDSPDTAPIGFLNAFDLIDKYRPARVLAECAAKRAIVEMHAPVDYSGLGMESPNACTPMWGGSRDA